MPALLMVLETDASRKLQLAHRDFRIQAGDNTVITPSVEQSTQSAPMRLAGQAPGD
jgi:hypothetical protein